MFKLIGAILCGSVAAGAVAYYATRPDQQRAADMRAAKDTLNTIAASVKNYFVQLFQSKPDAPPATNNV